MTIYDLIAELRREHQSPAATRALDLVSTALGETGDNLRQALARVEERGVPAAGREVLDELLRRATAEGLDDLSPASVPGPDEDDEEPLDAGTIGVGLLMGGTALLALALVAVVVISGFNQIFHWF